MGEDPAADFVQAGDGHGEAAAAIRGIAEELRGVPAAFTDVAGLFGIEFEHDGGGIAIFDDAEALREIVRDIEILWGREVLVQRRGLLDAEEEEVAHGVAQVAVGDEIPVATVVVQAVRIDHAFAGDIA